MPINTKNDDLSNIEKEVFQKQACMKEILQKKDTHYIHFMKWMHEIYLLKKIAMKLVY